MNFKELESKLKEYYDDFEELKVKKIMEYQYNSTYSFITYRNDKKTFVLFSFDTYNKESEKYNDIYQVEYKVFNIDNYENKINCDDGKFKKRLDVNDKFFSQFIGLKYDYGEVDKK